MKYFTIDELTRSHKAKKLGIHNVPNDEELRNLHELIEYILDPLREAYGYPIIINSGFRCKELNRKIGGVPTSSHLSGRSADITTLSKENNKKLFKLAQELELPFFELIDERDYTWIHISYNPSKEPRIRHLK